MSEQKGNLSCEFNLEPIAALFGNRINKLFFENKTNNNLPFIIYYKSIKKILCTRLLDLTIVTKIENLKISSLTVICVLHYCKCLGLCRGKTTSNEETEPFKQFKAGYKKPSCGCRPRYLFYFSPQSLVFCFIDICW